MKGDFRRYLAAKESVDDRAFAPGVRRLVRSDLAGRPDGLRLLDAGTGTGSFLRRLLAWDVPDLAYVAVDADGVNLDLARERVAATAPAAGYAVDSIDSEGDGDGDHEADFDFAVPGETVGSLSLRGENAIDVRFVRGDALDAADAGGWDFVVAQAFVDLLDPAGVDRLLDGLAPGGRFYFPITFDGGTAFAPPHDADDAVLSAYHATMDGGDRLGSRAGRVLERRLDARGIDYVAADADWSVRPVDGGDGPAGRRDYPADEAYFLRVLVDTVADAVGVRVDEGRRRRWHRARRRELDARRLSYTARNRDVTGVV
ncbi:class I SAM-dependent methyltransferase [Halogeometricum luteum]|uniref:Class I SAM-dependent methyltransferase n=1 Tax=Halogeometricum luteum TaxID=2950537 RepID=A0ABU2G725_9EURY|nr:class I SAM-dependent methyltransferase [Halogeometricum sp. S3BR5-2]MDS0295958.1 class I SAM-dependent methyltransferase [Halogeometricum sp. S3BR5-2]